MVSRYFQIGDVHFGVRTTSYAFGEWLDSALGRFRVSEQADFRYSIVVGDGEGGAGRARPLNIFYWGSVPLIRTLHLRTLVEGFLTELGSITAAGRDDAVYVRALPVIKGNVVGLIPISLALALGDRSRQARKVGVSFGAAMTVALDAESGRIGAFAPDLGIPSGSEELLDELCAANGSGDRMIFDEPMPVSAVFTMASGPLRPSMPLVEPISRAAALYRIAPWVLNFSSVRPRAIAGLNNLVRDARCHALGPTNDSRVLLGTLADAVAGAKR